MCILWWIHNRLFDWRNSIVHCILLSWAICFHMVLFCSNWSHTHIAQNTCKSLTQTNVLPLCLRGKNFFFLHACVFFDVDIHYVKWIVMLPQCDDIKFCQFKLFRLMSDVTGLSDLLSESAWHLVDLCQIRPQYLICRPAHFWHIKCGIHCKKILKPEQK